MIERRPITEENFLDGFGLKLAQAYGYRDQKAERLDEIFFQGA